MFACAVFGRVKDAERGDEEESGVGILRGGRLHGDVPTVHQVGETISWKHVEPDCTPAHDTLRTVRGDGRRRPPREDGPCRSGEQAIGLAWTTQATRSK